MRAVVEWWMTVEEMTCNNFLDITCCFLVCGGNNLLRHFALRARLLHAHATARLPYNFLLLSISSSKSSSPPAQKEQNIINGFCALFTRQLFGMACARMARAKKQKNQTKHAHAVMYMAAFWRGAFRRTDLDSNSFRQ